MRYVANATADSAMVEHPSTVFTERAPSLLQTICSKGKESYACFDLTGGTASAS
jgi:hypothetical protein